MPVQTTYPGVYIEERPSGVHTITGVATSDTAFVGATRLGPTNVPIPVQSPAEFTRRFGGTWDRDHPLAHAVGHFFANGGSKAIIVRVPANNAKAASVPLQDATPVTVLTLTANGEGSWAEATGASGLRVKVDYAATANKDDLFSLTLTLSGVDPRSGASVVLTEESFPNLSMSSTNPRFAPTVLANSLLTTTVYTKPGNPATKGSSTSAANLADPLTTLPVPFGLRVAVDGGPPTDLSVNPPTKKLADVATAIDAAVKAAGLSAGAALNGKLVAITSTGGDVQNTSVTVTPASVADGSSSLLLGRAFGGLEVSGSAPVRPVEGSFGFTGSDDGGVNSSGIVTSAEVVPSDTTKGIYALSQLLFPRFELLCLPDVPATQSTIPATAANNQALTNAMSYCRGERAFLLVDTPRDPGPPVIDWTVSPSPALGGLPALGEYGAIYYPRLNVVEPGPGGSAVTLDLPPCGAVAGVIANTDATRGVWKAPAGLQSGIVGASDLSLVTNDAVSGNLNPHGVNVLRIFPGAGMVVWGARTLKGDDNQGSEFKYVPVRRLTNYLASSLYLGTQFAVFEPNDPDLWGELRLAVGTFMRGLFRQGAFQQSEKRAESDSFFVTCDATVNPQSEIDLGRVNVVVGFAPLKPAEFVIITITQMSNLEA